jgi:hypothetical protein
MEHAILEREALKLPPHERALLADALLVSLDNEAAEKAEAACADEAEDRFQAYQRGEVEALDGPSVLKKLHERYSK